MRARHLLRSVATVCLGAGLMTVAGGAASAFWTGQGTGIGSATTASVQPITVTLVPAASLYPGQPAQAVALRLTNPNPFAVTVTRIAPAAVTVSGGAGCTPENAAVAFATLTGSWTVGANGSTGPTSVPAGVSMGPTAASGCQGASFTASLTVTAATG